MWTLLVVLCLLASFDVNAAKRSSHEGSSLERSDSTVTELKTVEESPARIPRRFRGNSRTRRLHIENQHGFDGKVEKIHINSEEDLPGVRAYGSQRKNQLDNGHIERMTEKEAIEEVDANSRATRSIEAYGKNKEFLDTNGRIERVQPSMISSSSYQAPRISQSRPTRSIETESKQESPEDLEAHDAKVFRPLFVYRQQVARRQHRARNQIHGFRNYQQVHQDRRYFF